MPFHSIAVVKEKGAIQMPMMLVSAILLSPIFAQQPQRDQVGDAAERDRFPELQPAFMDEFAHDTRAKYRVAGDVSWRPGQLRLSQDSSIDHTLDAGTWVRLDLDVEWPELTIDEPSSELQIRLRLYGADDCFVRLRRTWKSGRERGKVSLIDVQETDGEESANLVRETQAIWKSGRIRLEYRNGLVSVSQADSKILIAYVRKGFATVDGITIKSLVGDLTMKGLNADQSQRLKSEFRRDELLQLAEARERNQQFLRAFKAGDYSQAVEHSSRIVAIKKAVFGTHHPSYATSLNNLSASQFKAGNYGAAEQVYEEAIRVSRSVLGDQHPEFARNLNNLAALYHRLGNYVRAERLYMQSLKIDEAAFGDHHPSQATTLSNVSLLRKELGDFAGAEELMKRVIELRRSTVGDQHPAYAASLENLAELYRTLGFGTRAEPLYKEAIKIQKSTLGERHPEYARSLNNLATLYYAMSDSEAAEKLFMQAIEIQRAVLGKEHPTYATTLYNLAELYQAKREFTRAETMYRETLEIRESALGTKHPAYASGLCELANLYVQMGEYAKAEPLLNKARDIRQSVLGAKHPEYANSLHDLAVLYSAWRKPDRAESLYQQVLDIHESVFGVDHPRYVTTLYNLASLYYSCGDHARAASGLREAVEGTRAKLAIDSVVQPERLQKRSQSQQRARLDTQIANALQNGSAQRDALESMWRWKGAVSFRQRAYRAVAQDRQLVPLFESLQTVSRQLSVLASRTPAPPPPGSSEERMAATFAARARWEKGFSQLNQMREDLEQRIARGSREFRELAKPITVNQVQQWIPSGTALVDFLEYGHTSFDWEKKFPVEREQRFVAFVVTSDREPAMIELGPASFYGNAISVFRRPFLIGQDTPKNREAALEAGRQLRAQLWVPIEKQLEGIDSVIISPDTVLGTLPFAALPGKEPNRFLLEQYRLTLFPFTGLLQSTVQTTSQSISGNGLLVLGDVDYNARVPSDSDPPPLSRTAELSAERQKLASLRGRGAGTWDSLPGFAAELAIIEEIFRRRFGTSAAFRQLSGVDATESSFLKLAPSHRIVHVITHGHFEGPEVKSIDQARFPARDTVSRSSRFDPLINAYLPGLLSGLVMAGANHPSDDPEVGNDGILRASEIESASMSGVDLVVLSACETGLGAVAGGEGLTGLQRAFHIAGARSVIASLWDVDDLATQELMRQFYTNLWIKKMSKSDALREAQLWMLDHPEQLVAKGITSPTTRGMLRKRRPRVQEGESVERTSPFFWAAFSLSGDWR